MDAVTFLSALKHCKEQSIIFHHQTDSFSCHKATNTFYEEIVGLIDELIESYSGIYPKPMGYLSEPFVDYVDVPTTIQYFKDLYEFIKVSRTSIFPESFLQNQVDEIVQLVASTIYMLNLK
jgi:hypothetical protein